jgi:hypothetical protein
VTAALAAMTPPSDGSDDGKQPKPFQGPVLFVNHNAESMKARPHRHQVFTHVQSNYRRWKRREDANAIRSGANLSSGAKRNTKVKTVTHSTSTPSPDASLMTTVFTLTPPSSDEEAQEQVVEAVKRSVSPKTPVRKGNSDPFHAWSFEITPQINDLIKFYRDWILPSMYHTDSRKAVTSRSAVRDYADTVSGLQDEAGAYAFLSRNAFVATKSNPQMREIAAKYSGKSTKLLVDKIAGGKDLQNPTAFWHINNLWAGETIDNNLAAAMAHGKMVKHMMEEQVKTGKVDFKQLGYVIYTDCQMSATFLTSPIFDVEGWLPKVLAPVWTMAAAVAEKLLPPLSAEVNKVDACITDERLKAILVARRETTELWMTSRARTEEAEHSQLVFLWVLSRAVVLQGKLVNHYLAQKAKVSESEEEMDHIYAQQYIALAAIYLTRIWSFDVTVLGQPMFDAGPNILRRLRRLLEQSDRWPGGPSFHKYNNARFWALYVGALSEQLAAGHTKMKPERQWFNAKLAEQAYICDVEHWQAAREVLKGFVYNDHLPPHISTWFDRTLATRIPVE